MLPRLMIDFSRPRAKYTLPGIALLLAGGLLLVLSGIGFWQAAMANDLAHSEYEQATRKPAAKKHASPPPAPAVLLAEKQNQAVRDRLTLPWQPLLALIENYPGHDVALIGIDQNAGQRQIHITAEAKDTKAMLAYLSYMQHSALLHEALLNDHQVEPNVPGTPIRFQMTAIWGMP